MSEPPRYYVHRSPVWRDRANFILHAQVPDHPDKFEQLWTKRVAEDRFELCCIPFHVYNLSLADLLTTVPKGDLRYVFDRVVQHSGRFVFRVWFGDSSQSPEAVAVRLQELGALIEWSSRNLLAVDAIDQAHAQRLADYLADRERAGELIYETGRQ